MESSASLESDQSEELLNASRIILRDDTLLEADEEDSIELRAPTIEDLLPNEILGFIFLHLPCTKDLLSAANVSKQWFAMANDFAKRRSKEIFGGADATKCGTNWVNFYHHSMTIYTPFVQFKPSTPPSNTRNSRLAITSLIDVGLALRAARSGHDKYVIKMLSQHPRAKIEPDLITALALYSIQRGHVHFLSRLFEYAFSRSTKLLAGVDFHFLFLAAVRENHLRVAILIRCYANINVNDFGGPLWKKSPNPGLLGPYWRSFAQTSNVTALGICLSLNPPNMEMKQFLFSLGANWIDRGFCLFSNIPCAQLAISKGYTEFVKEIIAGGVTKPLLLASARNPLIEVFDLVAAEYPSPLPIKELLTTAIHTADNGEVTPIIRHLTSLSSFEIKSSCLFVALRICRYSIAKYLLDQGADIDYTEQHYTAFLKAISLSLDQTFLISLLDYNPNLNARTPENENVVSLAILKQLRRFFQKLLDMNKVQHHLSDALLTAVKVQSYDLAKQLIQHGADGYHTDKNNNNIYHLLFMNNPPKLRITFMYFLEMYFKESIKDVVNQQNVDGNTPLHLLLRHDDTADSLLIPTLMRYGALLDIPNDMGDTAFSILQGRNEIINSSHNAKVHSCIIA